MKQFVVFVAMLLVSGCATIPQYYAPSLPPDYRGPKAIVQDSTKSFGPTKSEFFYSSHIDSVEIDNSRALTVRMHQGTGVRMEPRTIGRSVPAKQISLTIVGRTEYSAPIYAMTMPVYEVKGSITFTPEPNKTYIVRGELGETYSAVWLEESISQRIIGSKIEIHGSAELGILKK